MADLLEKLQELHSLPPDLHWFCSKDADSTSAPGQTRVKSEYAVGQSPELRREHISECMGLFAYDSVDAISYQDQLAQDIDTQLSRCDNCIVGYYKLRRHMNEALRSDYGDDTAEPLIKTLDRRDITRIRKGLDEATQVLRAAEPPDRHKGVLDLGSQLALFEALNSEAFLTDSTVLEGHFQEPFKLVQTKRRLRVTHYVPAATRFLFDTNHERSSWAVFAWSKYSLVSSQEEFQFAIHDALLEILQRMFDNPPDVGFLPHLWRGLGLIVDKLNNDLVTHSLRAMEKDLFRLALEHLQYDSEGLRYLIQTIQRLLEIAPKVFWDSMGAISPTTILEQIFNNPRFDKYMETARDNEGYESSPLKDALSWIRPFMASLKTDHQVPACRSLVFQLLDRLQADRFPSHARLDCKRVGLATLAWTLNNCNKDNAILNQTGRVVVAEALDVANNYVEKFMPILAFSPDDEIYQTCSETCLKIVKMVLALECKALRTDQEALRHDQEVPEGYTSQSSAVWDAVVKHLNRGNTAVAGAALVGINDLTGLEKFRVLSDDHRTKEKSAFNVRLGRIAHLVGQILERINDFNPTDLDKLFKTSDTATALVAALFSPDANLYEAGVNLIKSISYESARKEAIGHLLQTFFEITLNAFSWATRRIARNRTFASCPRMLKTSTDVLDILCDPQNGVLRTRTLSGLAEVKAVENFWEHQWEGLKVIYEMTERWGKAKVAEANVLKEFCRDTMQFSQRLFDQYGVFANAIGSAASIKQEEGPPTPQNDIVGQKLLSYPAEIMEFMVKWLRLRDAFLIEISIKLTTKVLSRLSDLNMKLADRPSDFLEQIVSGGSQARSNLQPQEKAELAEALEVNLGRPIAGFDRKQLVANKKTKAGTIDLTAWKSKAMNSDNVVEVSDDEFGDAELPDQDLLSVSRSTQLMKEMQAFTKEQSEKKKQMSIRERKGVTALNAAREQKTKMTKPNLPSDVERAQFREKREKEREAKKKRDAETLALVKRKAGISGPSLGEGSGLKDIGVKGKDHAPKAQSMMVSSGSESESDDDLDAELFGDAPKTGNDLKDDRYYKPNQALQDQYRGPVKKTRQMRSAKDMRARLAPDLTALHRTILSWDFFHNSDFPPGSDRNDYSLVTNVFRTPIDYQSTFEPLLILEAWQGFLKSKEEGNFKSFELRIASRMNVDAFLELSTSIPTTEGKELGISEADIVLISKGQSPTADSQQPHCLARVWKINRKKTAMEITFRANVGNGLVTLMVPNATLYAVKISSMTPLEREYGALLGLKYFDLCDEIIKAKPSPLLEYSEKQLTPLVTNYGINVAQARAIKSAVDNDAFTLIQGPPGSGKTKTIVAIVGALSTNSFNDKGVPITQPQASKIQRPGNGSAAKKLLVCAPSNAAVDELVMRFKEGVKTANGTLKKLSIIRLGRSDAINANVLDVTLEELMNAKLNLASGKSKSTGDDIHQIMLAHKATSDDLFALRAETDALKASGKPVSSEQDRQFELLKRKKQQLSNQIDAARDSGDVKARDAELNRRRVQQEILDGAHVICATLSGSGHEMFQGLNIEFETVIIDEAAQSIELSALIPLKYGCSKCILVGDPKQLPPTVLSREAARFQYEQSLFVRMQANHPQDVHLLDTQYRMHPEISMFPSNTFYDSRLLDGPGMAKLRTRPWHQSKILAPYRFFDVQGQHQSAPRGHSLINIAEIDIALRLFDRLVTDCKSYDFRGKVGIITPYKSQLCELRSRFAQRYGDTIFATIEFNTTDAFQGRESEIIIFSCVRASFTKGIGFLSDIRRMNVGITRAKCSLWVLGNSQSLTQGEFWGRLVQDAKTRDRYSSGDLHKMLSKSSTNHASTKQASAAISDDRDIEMPDAPDIRDASPTMRHSADETGLQDNKLPQETGSQKYHPAGGANGLNVNGNCQRCGSFAHYTHFCDNPEVAAQSKLQCFRCKEEGHTKAHCTADRCSLCGEFGHTKAICTSTKMLTNNEKLRIGKQEAEHNVLLQSAPEMHRKRQLGDHDKQVPMIRSTSQTPPPGDNTKIAAGQGLQPGMKRRRGSSPPAGAPKGPKIVKGGYKTTQQNPARPSGATPKPLSSLANGVPNISSKDSIMTSQLGTAKSLSSSSRPINMSEAKQASRRGENVHEILNGPARPFPPPLSGPVRIPKRKKEVDPFIRPKKRP